MVALSERIVAALALACSLTAALVAQPGPAAADDSRGMPCLVGHRFEPGPIVNGHNNQPTRGEFEARMQELRALSQGSAGSCAAPRLSSAADDMASGTRPASALATPKR
jgi:hypothetical protein